MAPFTAASATSKSWIFMSNSKNHWQLFLCHSFRRKKFSRSVLMIWNKGGSDWNDTFSWLDRIQRSPSPIYYELFCSKLNRNQHPLKHTKQTSKFTWWTNTALIFQWVECIQPKINNFLISSIIFLDFNHRMQFQSAWKGFKSHRRFR